MIYIVMSTDSFGESRGIHKIFKKLKDAQKYLNDEHNKDFEFQSKTMNHDNHYTREEVNDMFCLRWDIESHKVH